MTRLRLFVFFFFLGSFGHLSLASVRPVDQAIKLADNILAFLEKKLEGHVLNDFKASPIIGMSKTADLPKSFEHFYKLVQNVYNSEPGPTFAELKSLYSMIEMIQKLLEAVENMQEVYEQTWRKNPAFFLHKQVKQFGFSPSIELTKGFKTKCQQALALLAGVTDDDPYLTEVTNGDPYSFNLDDDDDDDDNGNISINDLTPKELAEMGLTIL